MSSLVYADYRSLSLKHDIDDNVARKEKVESWVFKEKMQTQVLMM